MYLLLLSTIIFGRCIHISTSGDNNVTLYCTVLLNLPSELQLKSDHKPIEHLNDWKRKIVVMYTDKDPSHEDPNLVWRRDAIISIAEDKEVGLRENEALGVVIYCSWLQESK